MFMQNRKGSVYVLRGKKHHEPSFISHIERIQPKNFTGSTDWMTNRYARFFNRHGERTGCCEFVEGTGQATTGQISKTMDSNIVIEQIGNDGMEWCGIAEQVP